jgi:hypothetical protein
MESLLHLATSWREEAVRLRTRYAAVELAHLAETCAAELEAAIRTEFDELLTVVDAARECGYSASQLRRLLAQGAIPNAGRKGSPRIRRGNLPRKARASADRERAAPAAEKRGRGRVVSLRGAGRSPEAAAARVAERLGRAGLSPAR